MGCAYFVTGTDTGVGKTMIAVALLEAAAQQGFSTAVIKPVAAGCDKTPEGLRNDDACRLRQACTFPLRYEQINPIALAPGIAPHFAAERLGLTLDAGDLARHCESILALDADYTFIEGAGGWRVPLNGHETFADIAKQLNLPVILVVDIKLGCLNQALLSAEAIQSDGLKLAAWVANQAGDKDECHREMVDALCKRLPCYFLGDVPHVKQVGDDFQLATYLKTDDFFI